MARSHKRTDVYKKEILISRHYWITDEIQINLIKISTVNNVNLSFVVRKALKQYILKELKNKKYGFKNNDGND